MDDQFPWHWPGSLERACRVNRHLFLLSVLCDDLGLDVGGDQLIMAQRHRIASASAGNTFKLAVVLRYFCQRYLCLDDDKIAS